MCIFATKLIQIKYNSSFESQSHDLLNELGIKKLSFHVVEYNIIRFVYIPHTRQLIILLCENSQICPNFENMYLHNQIDSDKV